MAYNGNKNNVQEQQDWQSFEDASNTRVALLTVQLWQSIYESEIESNYV